MEQLLALSPLPIGFALLMLEVHLMLRLSPRYYRLVCRVPTRPVTLPDNLPDDALLRGEGLEVCVGWDGIQVRSTRKKHHILLRVDRGGQARAGAAVCMWLCLAVWLGVVGLLAVASVGRPLAEMLAMLSGSLVMLAGLGALLRWRTSKMIAGVEKLLSVYGAGEGDALRRRAAIPETAG
ncbi:MAG: hypothetical protein ACI8RZ_000839 [Myxococcota bacterium]|jgi:hypothetical protein